MTDYFYFFYPNKQELVINALLTGLAPPAANQNFHTTRATLDFMISHMPIHMGYNTKAEKVMLGKSAILLLNQMDFATNSKIPTWLFGHFEEDGADVSRDDPAVETIVSSLKELFELSMHPEDHASSPLLGQFMRQAAQAAMGTRAQAVDKLINATTHVLIKIFNEESTIKPVLEVLSVDLVRFIQHHLDLKSTLAPQARFREHVQSLLDSFRGNYDRLLDALKAKMSTEMEQLQNAMLDFEADVDHSKENESKLDALKERALFSIKQISFAFSDLQAVNQKLLHEEQTHVELTETLLELVKRLNGVVEARASASLNVALLTPGLEVVDQILDLLYDGHARILKKMRLTKAFKESIAQFNALYEQVAHKIIKSSRTGRARSSIAGRPDNENRRQEIEAYRKCNVIMLKIFQF